MSDLPTRFRSIFSGKNVISPTAHHHEFGASHQSIEGSNDQSFGSFSPQSLHFLPPIWDGKVTSGGWHR